MRHIEIVTCANCGEKFEARSKSAKYCSHSCANHAYHLRRGKKKRKTEYGGCPHNVNVKCRVHMCDSCGWNPEVAQRRLDNLLGKECAT